MWQNHQLVQGSSYSSLSGWLEQCLWLVNAFPPGVGLRRNNNVRLKNGQQLCTNCYKCKGAASEPASTWLQLRTCMEFCEPDA